MKIVFTADVQAYPRSAVATYDGWLNSRLKSVSDVLLFAADRAAGGVLVINGDLFHNRETLGIDVINVVISAIRACADRCSEVVISAGNHDQYKRDGSVSSLVMLDYMKGVSVVPSEGASLTFGRGSRAIHILPHTVDHEKVRQFVKSVDGGTLVLHQGVAGALIGNAVSTSSLKLSDLEAERFDHVILGDYHKPQKMAKNVWYIGSPVQHDWGEAGDEKRILVLDTETNALTSVPTNCPEFRKATADEWLNHVDRDDHFYRITADATDRKRLPKDLPPNVEVVSPTTASAAPDAAASFDVSSHIAAWLTAKGCAHLLPKAMERLAA